jgi:hypothetical protein
MDKINWKAKLTSRKFWMALAAFIVGVLALFRIDANTTTQISGIIMSLGAVIAYIVGEGLVDASAAKASNVITAQVKPDKTEATADSKATTPADTATQS